MSKKTEYDEAYSQGKNSTYGEEWGDAIFRPWKDDNRSKGYWDGVKTKNDWAGDSHYDPPSSSSSSSSGSNDCFVTTAVCNHFRKADDCIELETFRKFRDEWLYWQEGGRQDIERYYAEAPRIVKRIEESPNLKVIYHKVWNDYLLPGYQLILSGDNQGARVLYTSMMKHLANDFSY